MRILWYSAGFWLPTGYGRVSKEIVFRLLGRYEIYYLTANIHTHWSEPAIIEGIPTYGRFDFNWNKQVRKVIQVVQPDYIVTLHDIWWLTDQDYPPKPEMSAKEGDPWIAYFPVDAPLFEDCIIVQLARETLVSVAMSKFGYNELKKYIDHVVYIPHGVDTAKYKPLDASQFRKNYGFPDDKLIIGFVGENFSERKDIPRLMRAYKIFIENYPDLAKDTILYIHSSPNYRPGVSFDLVTIAKKLGIEKQVWFRTSYIPDTLMPLLYNTFYVYVTASRGEGFGLPVLEAQACGVPVIAPRNSSHIELVEGHGWLVDCGNEAETLWTPTHQAYPVVDVYKLADAIADAVNNEDKRNKYAKEARKFALKYDWNIIVEEWVKLFEEIAPKYK